MSIFIIRIEIQLLTCLLLFSLLMFDESLCQSNFLIWFSLYQDSFCSSAIIIIKPFNHLTLWWSEQFSLYLNSFYSNTIISIMPLNHLILYPTWLKLLSLYPDSLSAHIFNSIVPIRHLILSTFHLVETILIISIFILFIYAHQLCTYKTHDSVKHGWNSHIRQSRKTSAALCLMSCL